MLRWLRRWRARNEQRRVAKAIGLTAILLRAGFALSTATSAGSLDKCPDIRQKSSPHCIDQQQFCAGAYGGVPWDFASMANGTLARSFTDPRDPVSLVARASETTAMTLIAIGPERANLVASNIMAWVKENPTSIEDAARRHTLPDVFQPMTVINHCIKDGVLDFIDSTP